ncbi:cysteine--tRNA ligase [archaeon]|nr:cysteine--tRNA ligase [archaeon]
MLKIYNTLTRKKEAFKPINAGKVGIYTCGPTVYWYQHIGNLRSYVFSDVLKRVLRYDGYDVKDVINVTDVGHLTSDADTGEDKLEKAAKKEHKKASEIAKFYFDVFAQDLEKLNILKPKVWSWATKHIKEQIELVEKLEKKGYTYKTSDGIYFDTSKFKNYGKLSRKKISGLKAGKRIAMGEKKNKTDFALWKFSSSQEGKRQQEWNSPWGVGFPGWHVECSAMSMKYLGENFDIHTGGEDHIGVHHENEIAQSEAATGKKFVNYWMHGAFLILKGGKMSKSTGKILTISELEEKGFAPLSYRYFNFTAHYRKPLTWSLDGLEKAQDAYKRAKKIIANLKDDGKTNKKYLDEFEKAIDDDLDMPRAISILWKLLRDKNARGKIKTIKKMDSVFGLDLFEKGKKEIIPDDIKKLAEERAKARKGKNWDKADKLRQEIRKRGWQIKDIGAEWVLDKI